MANGKFYVCADNDTSAGELIRSARVGSLRLQAPGVSGRSPCAMRACMPSFQRRSTGQTGS